jgi:hypothetical protein
MVRQEERVPLLRSPTTNLEGGRTGDSREPGDK